MSKWTQFMDMHSGGGQKLNWAYIYIEAPELEAQVIFYNRFGRNPNRVTCTCCGPDYSISEADSLEKATEFNRGFSCLRPKEVAIPLEQYILSPEIKVIHATEIADAERVGELPEEGYVWQ